MKKPEGNPTEPTLRARKKGQRFTEEQKVFLLRRLAAWADGPEVIAGFGEAFGEALGKSGLSEFRIRHREEIETLRDKIRTRLANEVPIAAKLYRLEALQRLFQEHDRFRVTRYAEEKGSYGKTEKLIPIEEHPLGEVRRILELAAKEMGDLQTTTKVEAGESFTSLICAALGEEPPAAEE